MFFEVLKELFLSADEELLPLLLEDDDVPDEDDPDEEESLSEISANF